MRIARNRINKLTLLRERLGDPEWRRYGYLLLAGKLFGIALVLGAIVFFSSAIGTDVHADEAVPVLKGNDIVNPINTMWTLVAAFLVFGMQAGFTMLEAGFCRSRETVNVLMECVVDTCLCGLLFYAWGYAFMFGAGNGFIGWHDPNDAVKSWFFLGGITAATTYGATGVPVLAHWVFQFAFADCASTICSGTMIGRTSF